MQLSNRLVTLTATAQAVASLPTSVHRVWLQAGTANSAAFYWGGPGVTTSTGQRVEAPTTGVPAIPTPIDFGEHVVMDLANLYLVGGVGDIVRVCALEV